LYISKNGIYLNDIFLEQDNQYNIAFFWKDYIIYGNLKKLVKYSLSNQTTEKLDSDLSYYWDYFDSNKVMVSRNRRKDSKGIRIADYHLFSFENQSLSLPIFTDIPNIRVFGSNGLIINFNILKSLSLLTGEYEWELDLSGRKNPPESREEEAQIRQLVGIWQNQLIITMTNNELIRIDTQTGKILWETKQLTAQINQGPSYKWRGHLSFNGCHIESGKLYEIVGSVYYSIDLLTQAVEILWQDPRSEDYITVQHRTYTEDYIYFTGSVDGAFQPHIVGVFNRKTLSLEWIEDMSLPISPSMGYPASLNQPPQVTDNKLYVLDSGGTLHIFEKESSTE